MKHILVVPTFNCEIQIQRLLQRSFSTINRQFQELLIIDNGSTDNTLYVTLDAMKHITIKAKVVKNRKNIGLGGSLKTGFQYASENRFDYVSVLHGDDQASLDDILPMLECLDQKDFDLAIGARFHPSSKLIGYSTFRKLGNRILNLYCSVCAQTKIVDLIAGLNIFKVSKLNLDEVLHYPNNLTFDAHLLLRAIYLKQKISFFPITWRQEDQISNAKILRQGLIILFLFTRYALDQKTIVFFNKTANIYKDFEVIYEKS